MFKNKAVLMLASAMLAMPFAVQPQGVTPTAASKGGTVAADQIIARYEQFAGSKTNATSLVNGLRSGDDITLTGEVKTCTAYQQTCAAYEQTQTCVASTQTCVKTQRQPCMLGPSCPTGFKDVCVQYQATCTQYQTTSTSTCSQWQNTSVCATWGAKTASDTFSPRPAAPMGFGNVDIALALTEAKLRPNTTPSPADLKAALLEILGKRAGGEGWGEIAKSYGFQLK